MIPFDIFLGVCSGGLLFMLYFLMGFWREARRLSRSRARSAILIPVRQTVAIPQARTVPDFSLASTAREILIEESQRDLRPAWRVFVNPRRMKVAK